MDVLQIERHLALGGSDNPAEILLMFLFRYGQVQGYANIDSSARTSLSQLMVIESEDGGSADMGGVYQVENCVKVFQACWQRLRTRMNQKTNPSHSLLMHIVDARKLEMKRRECNLKASLITKYTQEHLTSSTISSRNQSREKKIESKSIPSRQLVSTNNRQPLTTDDEAEELLAGYNVTTIKNSKTTSSRSRNKKSRKHESSKQRKRLKKC